MSNPPKGRGAFTNRSSRYLSEDREPFDDGWPSGEIQAPRTELSEDSSRSIISWNESPDIPFDRSVNPYRGCEHGCIYCYARPTHAWLGLSPGLDFETRLFYKPHAARLLERALARADYRPATLVLGANTDPYQPVERRLGITRQVLEVLRDCAHPVAITTKSAGVLRDMDLLESMAERRLAVVQISITTLDKELARRLEPRAAAPQRRLEAIRELGRAGVPVGVLVSPLIPGLTDSDLERVVDAAAEAGATRAGCLLLRLPLEVSGLFQEWLRSRYPDRAERVLGLIRQCRGGRLNDAEFGRRFVGAGPVAQLLHQRFELVTARLGLVRRDAGWDLDTQAFRPPKLPGSQLSLF
jgi:DNA repair photolyase